MRYKGEYIIQDGAISPAEAQAPIGTDGEVYEVLRVQNGCPLFLDEHLGRLRRSMTRKGIAQPEWLDSIATLIRSLARKNDICDCDMRFSVSHTGAMQCGFVPTTYPTRHDYEDGVRCLLLNATRETPELKVFHAKMRQDAELQQKQNDIYESILVNADGNITEGSRSNIFFVSNDGTLVTAPTEFVLGGVVRKKVLELCDKFGIKTSFRLVNQCEIDHFAAAFLTSTPMRVLPIASIGGKTFSTDSPTLTSIMQKMEDLVQSEIAQWQ